MSWNVGDATGVLPPVEGVVGVIASLPWQDAYLLQEVLTSQRCALIVDGIAAAGGGAYNVAWDEGLRVAVLCRGAIESRAPFVARSSPLRRGALLVRTSVAGVPVALVDVHLDPIPKQRDPSGTVNLGVLGAIRMGLAEMLTRTPRSGAVAEMLAWLDGLAQGPVATVVAGDFNTVSSSWAIGLMSERFVDAANSVGKARGTYRRVRLPILPRVDFVFVSDWLRVADSTTVRRTPGDHYPVLATVELP
jgi:endonuclease/exonuclease/phosphatase family metal-dependent hydrolase